jgi:hypothetical protein
MSPKESAINSAHNLPLTADLLKRKEMEGAFGPGRRKDLIRLITTRLLKGIKASISMAFLAKYAE